MKSERLILSDAIRTAIEAHRTVIIQRMIIAALSLLLIASVGIKHGQILD